MRTIIPIKKVGKRFVDVYWDDELKPPCWGARSGYIEKDGSLVVMDFDCAENKGEAIKIAKEWAKKLESRKLKKII